MKILVINSGSSSIKYKCFEMPQRTVLASGLCEKIGEPTGRLTHRVADQEANVTERAFADHAAALEEVLSRLNGPGGVLEHADDIGGVGHRLVHGGEAFSQSVLVDDEVIAAVQENIPLAPLHNPPNLLGLQIGRRLLPGVPQVGVFDTAGDGTSLGTIAHACISTVKNKNKQRNLFIIESSKKLDYYDQQWAK